MCYSPIRIKNPNFGLGHIGINYLKDCSSAYINIPCGHCADCIRNRQMAMVQRSQMESEFNHMFFCTLTYNNSMLPHEEVNGFNIPYADIHDVQNMMKRLRKYDVFGRPFRYYCVSELGSQNGRPHFHILFFVPKYKGDDYNTCLNLEALAKPQILAHWSRNVSGSTKRPIYEPCCTFKQKYRRGKINSNFDFHYVNPALSTDGTNDVSWYCMKYMLKQSPRAERLQQALHLNLDAEAYYKVWNRVKPKNTKSIGFGLDMRKDWTGYYPNKDLVAFLHENAMSFAKEYPFPVFVNPNTGQSFPLARYYRCHSDIFSAADAVRLRELHPTLTGDGYVETPENIVEKAKRKYSKFVRSVETVESHDQSSEFTNIDYGPDIIEVVDYETGEITTMTLDTFDRVLTETYGSGESYRYTNDFDDYDFDNDKNKPFTI